MPWEAKGTQNDLREGRMKKSVVGALLTLGLMLPLEAHPAVPQEIVKSHVNKILEVLRDPAFRGEAGKKIKKEKIRAITEEMFDFAELSRRSLGQNWEKFSADQQKEFVKLYKSLLEETYTEKITSYTDEKIVYKKETNLSEKTVEVQTVILTKNSEVPVYYRLMERDQDWKVYDVVIEGVSLVSNYRTQFREILASKTPGELLEILRKKVIKG
jgi:phospholipid transport system substrate-binding protein